MNTIIQASLLVIFVCLPEIHGGLWYLRYEKQSRTKFHILLVMFTVDANKHTFLSKRRKSSYSMPPYQIGGDLFIT